MKTLDVKSLLIGALLTSTIFLGVAATSKEDAGKWDSDQQWQTRRFPIDALERVGTVKQPKGWEPFASDGQDLVLRKRIENWTPPKK